MTTEKMMEFKKNYNEALKTKSKKVILTAYEARRKDVWAENVFGSSEFAFMFDVLIPNVDDAKELGYLIVV